MSFCSMVADEVESVGCQRKVRRQLARTRDMASAAEIKALLKEELDLLKQELLIELRREQQFHTPGWLPRKATEDNIGAGSDPDAEEDEHAAATRPEARALLMHQPAPVQAGLSTRIMTHPAFELFSISLVVSNVVWIGVQGEYAARMWTRHPPGWFNVADLAFCIAFVLENAVKIAAQRRNFFCEMPAAKWNLFDFFSTLSQVFEFSFVATGGHSIHASGGMKLLRIFRLVRIARVANAFPDLKKLIASVAAAFKPLGWTMVLVVLLTYAFALAVTQVVTDHKIAVGREDMEHTQEELLKFYDTVGGTFISFYMIVSEGIHWGELMTPLAAHISPVFQLIFCLFVAFQLFAMMNVITAYFVESAFKAAAENEKKELTNDLLQVVHLGAKSSGLNGSEMWVTKEVFEKYSQHPKMDDFLGLLGVDAEEGHHVWDLLDSEGAGKIGIDEFVKGCRKLVGVARAENICRLQFQMKQNHRQIMAEMKKLQSDRGKWEMKD